MHSVANAHAQSESPSLTYNHDDQNSDKPLPANILEPSLPKIDNTASLYMCGNNKHQSLNSQKNVSANATSGNNTLYENVYADHRIKLKSNMTQRPVTQSE